MGIREAKTFLLIVSISLLAFCFSLLHAAAPEKELTDISKKIEERKEKVKKTKAEEKSLATNLKTIGFSIKKNADDIRKYNQMISEKSANIDSVNQSTGSLQAGLAKRKEYLYERLRTIYKFRQNEIALFFVSAADYQDFGRKRKYLEYIAGYDRRLIEDIRAGLVKLDVNKQELETLKNSLESDRKILSKKTKELEAQKRKKNSLLTSVKERRSNYEKELEELTKASKRLRAMMKRISRMGSSKPSVDKGFSSMKGRLPWPVNGSIVLPFGKYIDPELKIPVYKNGVEIKTSLGSPVEAIMGGKIVFADKFKGYGLLVIIDHGGGYHSLYGQLSEIFHETGAIIKKGSVIGKAGMSKSLGIPTLYFEIRDKGKPVDPVNWLMKNRIDKTSKK
ncbi:MAG: peptidoglycan DD-metalloendopeptidase family protein [Thermodesulfovibrionia bacterium]|nr:peptidoglycan DD-metalloendopeptidase family protein [Thermodesulfovibrionia bacterium]